VKSIKTRIAVLATVLGLGGLAGLALSAGKQGVSQPVAAKPLVRTKVIRRTIHVTKHAKPKHPAVAAPPVAAASTAPPPVTTGGGAEEPVTTSTSGSGGEPVTTATSSSGGGGEEHEVEYESEGGEVGDD